MADGDVTRALRALAARVSRLEIDGERLQESLAHELRTRRVVIVDDDGWERIALAAHERFGHVTVFGRGAGDDSTAVELFASDPANGDGVEVGVALIHHGDTVATLHVFEGQQPVLWIDESPPDA